MGFPALGGHKRPPVPPLWMYLHQLPITPSPIKTPVCFPAFWQVFHPTPWGFNIPTRRVGCVFLAILPAFQVASLSTPWKKDSCLPFLVFMGFYGVFKA